MPLDLPDVGGDNNTWGGKLNAALAALEAADTAASGTYVAADGEGGYTVAGEPVDLGGYTAPVGGIPKADLAAAVQTSLDKADAAAVASAVTAALATKIGIKEQVWWSTYNWTAPSTRRLRNALARQRTGGQGCRMVCAGDSTTLGSSNGVDAAVHSYPAQLPALLTARGVLGPAPVAKGGILTSDGAAGTDPRLAVGAGWSGPGSLGYQANSSAGGSLVYTPGRKANKFTVLFLIPASGGSTFTLSVDGGTPQTVTFAAGASVGSASITTTAADGHVLTISKPAANTLYVVGIFDEDTTAPATSVTRAGQGGIESTGWANTGYTMPLPQMLALAPDAVLYMIGANDFTQSRTLASLSSSLTTFCNAVRAANADPILVVPYFKMVGKPYTWAEAQAVYYAVADALDVPLVDLSARWSAPATTVEAAPYNYSDGLHHNAKGYADLAAMVATALANVAA